MVNRNEDQLTHTHYLGFQIDYEWIIGLCGLLFTGANGDIYEGEWKDGKRHRKGN